MSKNIIIFYPTFAGGGITKNLENILEYFKKKKLFVYLFSYQTKNLKKKKNLQIIDTQYKMINNNSSLLNIISSSINLISFLSKNSNVNTILSMQNHLPAIIIGKIFRKKIIIRNSEEIFSATKYADNFFSAYLVLFLKFFIYKFCDHFIAISKKSKQSLKKLMIKNEKITIIYNPFIKQIKKKTKKSYLYGQEFYILSAGRLTKQKNFLNLIKSIQVLQKKYPFINLNIIGNGPDQEKLNNLSFGNKKISIKKWNNDLEKYFKKSHLFILNSLYEGLPNILIESVNNSLPCLSTNCSGVKDILLNNKGGFIVPINSDILLKDKIEFIMKNYKIAVKKSNVAKKNIYRFTQDNCEDYYKLLLKYI